MGANMEAVNLSGKVACQILGHGKMEGDFDIMEDPETRLGKRCCRCGEIHGVRWDYISVHRNGTGKWILTWR